MIVELREEKGEQQQQHHSSGNYNENIENQNQNQKEQRKLFRVRSSIKEKNKYYDVDIQKGTCTCPDFQIKLNKCKHIVATELFLF